MLKLKYLFENFDLAKKVLENWDHDTEHLDESLRNFRISSNAIYPFTVNGKMCFLRLSPCSEKVDKNIYGELEFIEYLNLNQYSALKPVSSRSGENILVVQTEWGKYFASVFEKVS